MCSSFKLTYFKSFDIPAGIIRPFNTYGPRQSARAIIREHIPENAATIAIIDEIFKIYNKSLSEIEQTDIQNSAKQTFKALFELGVKPLM
jgi:nucleoside-diphosphate-sugar epimerase